MAMTEAQIAAAIYKEIDRIGVEIGKSRATVSKLCEDMPGSFVRDKQSALSRGIKGKLIVKAEDQDKRATASRRTDVTSLERTG